MIIIGDKVFKTKEETKSFIQEILYRNSIGRALVGEDLDFVCELIQLHPRKDEKIGSGVKNIVVKEQRGVGSTKCFYIIRNDESEIDFSFYKCLYNSLDEPRKLFVISARRAAADQIIGFKDSFFEENQNKDSMVSSAISGELLNKNNCHVDHIPPETFHKIVDDFINRNSIDVNTIRFDQSGIGCTFIDESIKHSFSDYHRERAKLRIISVFENLSQRKY